MHNVEIPESVILTASDALAKAEGRGSFNQLNKADQKYYPKLMVKALTAALPYIPKETLNNSVSELTLQPAIDAAANALAAAEGRGSLRHMSYLDRGRYQELMKSVVIASLPHLLSIN